MKHLKLFFTLLVACLSFASPASAYFDQTGPMVNDPLVVQWVNIAQASWGASPESNPGIDCSLGIQVDMLERGGDINTWGMSQLHSCGFSLDPDWYPAPAKYSVSEAGMYHWREEMCNIVVHEWGHMLGKDHVDASVPDIMNANVPKVTPACAQSAEQASDAYARLKFKRKAYTDWTQRRTICKRKKSFAKRKACYKRAQSQLDIDLGQAKLAVAVVDPSNVFGATTIFTV